MYSLSGYSNTNRGKSHDEKRIRCDAMEQIWIRSRFDSTRMNWMNSIKRWKNAALATEPSICAGSSETVRLSSKQLLNHSAMRLTNYASESSNSKTKLKNRMGVVITAIKYLMH